MDSKPFEPLCSGHLSIVDAFCAVSWVSTIKRFTVSYKVSGPKQHTEMRLIKQTIVITVSILFIEVLATLNNFGKRVCNFFGFRKNFFF